MPRNEILILHCPAGGGHKAAASAVAERANALGMRARVIDALSFAPAWFARFYVDTHLRSSAYVPRLYGSAYFASNHRAAVDSELRRRFDRWIGRPLLDEIVASDPLAVIATHFFPMGKLVEARRRGVLSAPLIEVITDYAAHAVWAEPGADAYCAPHGRACDDLVAHGISADLVFPTGIPIRAAFADAPPIRCASKGLPLRVLVTSGGFGVGPVARVLRSFANVQNAGGPKAARGNITAGGPKAARGNITAGGPKAAPSNTTNLSLTVVCGENPRLLRRVQKITDRLGLPARVIGFEQQMHARVAEADVVVTKPGGLTVSECLAAGRPLVLVGAVPGQESLNQSWVTEQGAGLGCAPDEVGETIVKLRETNLLAMADRARAIGAPRAADRVLAVTLALVSQRRSLRPQVEKREIA